MKLIEDESSSDLTGLLSMIKSMAPEIWRSSDRRHILPQRLEDLEKPEYLDEIRSRGTSRGRGRLISRGSITMMDLNA